MKKINRRVYNVLNEALGTIKREKHVDIYTINDGVFLDEDAPLEYGVNWCAMGTQSVERTREYVKDLAHAADIAEALTSLELVVDWTQNDVKLKDDMKEEWKEWLPKFYEIVRLGCAELIEAGIDTMNKKFLEEV